MGENIKSSGFEVKVLKNEVSFDIDERISPQV